MYIILMLCTEYGQLIGEQASLQTQRHHHRKWSNKDLVFHETQYFSGLLSKIGNVMLYSFSHVQAFGWWTIINDTQTSISYLFWQNLYTYIYFPGQLVRFRNKIFSQCASVCILHVQQLQISDNNLTALD